MLLSRPFRGCSDNKAPGPEKGAIKKMTGETAKEAVNQIRTPFDSRLILPAAPAVPFREIVVTGLPWGACARKLAAVLPLPYAVKGDWQAHPAWDAVRSLAEPQGVDVAAGEMQATGRPPALAAAVAPGDSPSAQPRGCVSDELKVRASTGRPPVLAAAVVASDDSPAAQPRGCESDELIIRASAEQAA
jgi:hypothetical protein